MLKVLVGAMGQIYIYIFIFSSLYHKSLASSILMRDNFFYLFGSILFCRLAVRIDISCFTEKKSWYLVNTYNEICFSATVQILVDFFHDIYD